MSRPVYIRRAFDWLQTTLFQSVVTPTGLLMAGIRENVASNAQRISLSPDGNWVAVAGGGGFRPRKPVRGAGYGVAVFAASAIDHLQGFFKTDAYPAGVCFNPVTNQVAAVRSADASVYHLDDSATPVGLKGKFSGAGAWSGNGRYLILGNEGGGLSYYENTLSAAEKALAGTWWKKIKVIPVAPVGRPARPESFVAVEAYRKFTATALPRKELQTLLQKAARTGRTDRPGRWTSYSAYAASTEAALEAALEAARQVALNTDHGITIFKVRQALKKQPDSVPLQFFLAEALRQGDQADKAEKSYLAVIQADAGRTELSCLAFNKLAGLLSARDQELAALHCLACSLYLDRASPATLALALPLLKKNKFDAEAAELAKFNIEAPSAGVELPKLPKPTGKEAKYTPSALYQTAVHSVVLIESGKGTGSGVCVAQADLILTNDHVINAGEGALHVTAFTYKKKTLARLARVRARVVFRSPKEDVAVLKLEKPIPGMTPLLVAAEDRGAGEKVWAIGSPGLGKEVLEQSISEGLISSTRRKIGGSVYLQHSAAVNPGNSGGPLLDEHGHVVGLVTLKARLEGVSFAVRVETLRGIFKSP
jgi:S1-C subfamily serine protease